MIHLVWILLSLPLAHLVYLTLRDIYQRWFSAAYKAAVKLPGPTIFPVVGNLFEIATLDREKVFQKTRELSKKYQKSWRYYILGTVCYSCTRADEAELLISSSKHAEKGYIYNFLHPFIGTGLLCSNGTKWQQRRKILTPAFHFDILQNFHKSFKIETAKLVTSLRKEVGKENGSNLHQLMARYTLNVITETAMGVNLETIPNSDTYRKNIFEIGEEIIHRIHRPWLYDDFMYRLLGGFARLNRFLKPAHEFINSVIDHRRTLFKQLPAAELEAAQENVYLHKKQRYALLDMLLAAQANNQIDNAGIEEEVNTFTFEGYDTSSTAMTFILLLIGTHQDVQQKILEEIKYVNEQLQKDGTGNWEPNHYSSLEYMNRVIKESLRLYPPVCFISRTLTEDLVLDNCVIPMENSMAQLHIYDLHRDPQQFPDPEKFDPDRFLPEYTEKRHPFAYIPFSAGPRNCIGQKFAMLEIQTMLVEVLTQFQVEAITKREEIIFVADLILRSKNPIFMKFHLR